MSKIRKHWKASLVLVSAVLAAAAMAVLVRPAATAEEGAGSTGRPGPTTQAAETREEMSVQDYRHIRDLRNTVKLMNSYIAGAVSRDSGDAGAQAKAEAVFGALRTWYEQNRAEYLRRFKVKADAGAAVRRAKEERRTRGRDKEFVAHYFRLKSANVKALDALQEMRMAALAAALKPLSEEERARFLRIKRNFGLGRGWGYVTGLTSEQRHALSAAKRRHSRAAGRVRTKEQMDAAAAAFRKAQAEILSEAQIKEAAEAWARERANMGPVLEAERKVLPEPEGLHP